MKQGVYAVRNKVTGESYVGSSVYIEKRFSGHMRRLRRGDHQNRRLQTAWNEHGDVFELVVLQETTRSNFREAEIAWIAALDSHRQGYNSTALGAGPDPETREKIRAANRRDNRSAAIVAESRSEAGRARRAEMMRDLNRSKGN